MNNKSFKISIGLMFVAVLVSISSQANYNGSSSHGESYALLNERLTSNKTVKAHNSYRYANGTYNQTDCIDFAKRSKCDWADTEFTRTSRGKYMVAIENGGVTVEGINVQVVAVGSDSVRCKIDDSGYGRGTRVDKRYNTFKVPVACYGINGALADSKFYISTVSAISRRKSQYEDHALINVHPDGTSWDVWNSMWINGHDIYNVYWDWYGEFAIYSSTSKKWDFFGGNTGLYEVALPGWRATDINSVRVTSKGRDSDFCTVISVNTATDKGHARVGTLAKVLVACWDNKGNLSDSGFDILVENYKKGPTGSGAQYAAGLKSEGSFSNWTRPKGWNQGTERKYMSDGSILLSHADYGQVGSFPFVSSTASKPAFCKLTQPVRTDPVRKKQGKYFVEVRIRCYDVTGKSYSNGSWSYSENLVWLR